MTIQERLNKVYKSAQQGLIALDPKYNNVGFHRIEFIIPRHKGDSHLSARSYLQVGELILLPQNILLNVSSREVYWEIVKLFSKSTSEFEDILENYKYPYLPYSLFDNEIDSEIDIPNTINQFIISILGSVYAAERPAPVDGLVEIDYTDHTDPFLYYVFVLSDYWKNKAGKYTEYRFVNHWAGSERVLLSDKMIYNEILKMEYDSYE